MLLRGWKLGGGGVVGCDLTMQHVVCLNNAEEQHHIKIREQKIKYIYS